MCDCQTLFENDLTDFFNGNLTGEGDYLFFLEMAENARDEEDLAEQLETHFDTLMRETCSHVFFQEWLVIAIETVNWRNPARELLSALEEM